MKKIAFILALIGLLRVGKADAMIVFSEDFESSRFSQWTLTTVASQYYYQKTPSTNGVGNETIIPFDTNYDGIESLSARFQTGRNEFLSPITYYNGILLSSSFVLPEESRIRFAADIASYHPYDSINGGPGRFDLWIGGLLVDTVEFDEITYGQTLYGQLFYESNLELQASQPYDVEIRISRSANVGETPFQYLDNISIDALDIEENNAAVPEPASLALFGTGLFGALVRRRFKKS